MRLCDNAVILSPEQQNAFNVLVKHLVRFSSIERLCYRPKEMFPTGYVACTNFPLTKENLPVDDSWVWNQSNAKVTVPLDASRTVAIQKMNPRKRRNGPSAPSYKLWIYVISELKEKDLYILWCEKGVVGYLPKIYADSKPESYTYGVATSIGIIYPGEITIEDLSFLSDFTDCVTATTLGWL